ncbi:MAG: MATE family efflux transporter [Defluviitaleaceae bacterium]|nr:MATE family efflux transporter [Defluviitaleaceae bacterium]
MPKNHIKNTKHATVFKAAKEQSNKAAESITKTPTWKHLLKFSFPTIISMLIMGTFGIVNGIFVSRLINPIALAAVSVVFPFLSFALAIGFMLGVGGNAMIAKKIGEGKEKEGRQNFSLITLVAVIVAGVAMLVGLLFPDLILNILGVDDFVRGMALDYLRPLLWFMPTTILGIIFQQFLITVGKAHYGAITALLGGITSTALNFVFIYLLDMGMQGAALATSIGYTLPAIVGLGYFTFIRSGKLYFVMPRLDFRALGRTCINGASEMVTMLAGSITAVLMNNILLDLGGAEAQAAAGIMFAGLGIFSALFVGYSSGVAPIISYNFGKGDTDNLKKVFSNSLRLIGVLSTLAMALAFIFTDLLISIYDVPVGIPMHEMARTGFRILAAGFVLMGFNSFASMFFTALNNGVVSSILSLFRTLIFVFITFLTLPVIFGLNGAWAAIPAAEVLAIIMTVLFFKVMKKKYKYA